MTSKANSWLVRCLTVIGVLTLRDTCAAEVSSSVVQQALESVFTVYCGEKAGTGFAVQGSQGRMLITALHVVGGCDKVRLELSNGTGVDSKIVRVSRPNDLAELHWPASFQRTPIEVRDVALNAGEPLALLGKGSTPTIQSKTRLKVRDTAKPTDTIKVLISGTEELDAVENLGFLSKKTRIINIEGDFFPGDSGGPLFDKSGKLVGIGNGGVDGGRVPITWGIPITGLRTLEGSSDKNHRPKHAVESSLLMSATVKPRANGMELYEIMTCSGAQFGLLSVDNLQAVYDVSDELSRTHLEAIQKIAHDDNQALDPNKLYATYLNPDTGAVFTIPADMRLDTSDAPGDACHFSVPNSSVDLWVGMAKAENSEHLEKIVVDYSTALGGEDAVEVPDLSMKDAVNRDDGMTAMRVTYEIGSPPGSKGHMVMSHAVKNLFYLGVAMRTNAPLGTQPPGVYPAVASVFSASYTPD